ncbi:MAG: GspE/PulE family protein [Firmicutes bacterium]|nr:GspE/PulE family protein [Bacillota bacterium]
MPTLIYESKNFLNGIRIENDGDSLVFTRKNISGETKSSVKLSQVRKISVEKSMLSYSLIIDREEGSPISLGGFECKAVEEISRNLGSLVEIKAEGGKKRGTPDEVRKGAAAILESLSGDFDPRHIITYIITQAVRLDSSDIHITPKKEAALIQFRIDGLLQEIARLDNENYSRLTAAVKNRAKLPSYKKSVPQDGSFHFDDEGLNLDIRCATIPTLHGEKLVLRILSTAKTPLFLDDLGFSPEILSAYKKAISEPQGCIVLTGPAGSGKTTTIFASLIHIYNNFSGTINIATIEDPVEYILDEFQQTQVQPVTGLTFAAGLKSLLRLDPDIILVGEIRDPETAQIAVRTALTGHLIFTTLHARDTLGVFPRLIEMDMKPGLVSSSVTASLYQRLIRKLCEKCKKEAEPPAELIREAATAGLKPETYYTAVGCPECSGSGYSGRTGVFELLIPDDTVRDMIMTGVSRQKINEYCRSKGMKFLRDDAIRRICEGVTDYSEIGRVCPTGNF